jgi:dienelactone hydrolase
MTLSVVASIRSFLTYPISLLCSKLLLGYRSSLASKLTAPNKLVGVTRIPASQLGTAPAVDVYYPCAKPEKTSTQRLPWLPSFENGSKWAQFIFGSDGIFFEQLIGLSTFLCFSQFKIHANLDAPMLPPSPQHNNQKYRVVIFSHGLATWGSHYSTLCTTLAQMGVVVFALDHRDGSATRARTSGEPILYERVEDRATERVMRARQLKQRVADVQECFEFVKKLNSTPSSRFSNALDTTGYAIAGHSFGGGTALACTSNPNCLGAMALDPWIYPVADAELLPAAKTEAPVVFVTADTGVLSSPPYWRKNCEYIEEYKDSCDAYRFRGMDHIDVSDVVPLLPRIGGQKQDQFFLAHDIVFRKFVREKLKWTEVSESDDAIENYEWIQTQAPY